MFTIIGGDGKEYGPATVEQLRGWIAAGRANLETKAKAVGSDEWRRLGDYPEFTSTAATPAPGIAPTYAAPASATPSSPEPITGPIDTKAFAADLIARSGKIDIFSCLDRGFKLWTSQFGSVIGSTWLIGLMVFCATLTFSLLLSRWPFAPNLAQTLIIGPLYGGLYYYYLGLIRGEARSIGDVFAGFSRNPGALVLGSLLTSLIPLLILGALAGPWFTSVMAEMQSARLSHTVPNIVPPSGMTLLGIMVGSLICMYLGIALFFTLPLIADRKLSAWSAMMVSLLVVSHQWFRVFFLSILAMIISMLGLIGLLIGVLFTIPIFIASMMYAYEDMFNPKRTAPTATTTALTS